MLSIKEMLSLQCRDSVKELESSKAHIIDLNVSNAELLDLADDMFRMGSKSHLRSLNPLIRKDLGFQLQHMTRSDAQLQLNYQEFKNKYISLGKSFSSISFLFDLVSQDFTLLDIVLMHELLMDDGQFRTNDVYIESANGSIKIFPAAHIEEKLVALLEWYSSIISEESISSSVIATLFHYYL